MFLSTQTFWDASDQIAFNKESSHEMRAASNVGHYYNSDALPEHIKYPWGLKIKATFLSISISKGKTLKKKQEQWVAVERVWCSCLHWRWLLGVSVGGRKFSSNLNERKLEQKTNWKKRKVNLNWISIST